MSRRRLVSRRGAVTALGVACGALALLAVWAAGESTAGSASAPQPAVTPADLRPLEDPADGYVSSKTCRSCHPGEYASWHHSFHRTMSQVASPETVLGDFDDVELTYHGWTYRLFEVDGLHFFEAERAAGVAGPGSPARLYRRPIVQTTGSHHIQVYWFPTGEGRALELFPFFWVIADAQWMPRESVFLQPTVHVDTPLADPDELLLWQRDRSWNHSCLHCHTTDARPGFPRPGMEADADASGASGPTQVDTRVSELGIACEACHGPGEEHVRRNRNPGRRYRLHLEDGGDDTMVQPTRGTIRDGSAVCGSCHSVFEPHAEDVDTIMVYGYGYQPGGSLAEDRLLLRPSQGTLGASGEIDLGQFWSDGQLRVSGREYTAVMDSPCFESADFGCSSCHEMHPQPDDPRTVETWRDDQLRMGMRSNAACIDCHSEYSDAEAAAAHSRHLAASDGSQCMNCHMSYTTYGLLKAMRSHEISSPRVATSLETGRPNACNQCHIDRTLSWSAEHLNAWYGQEIPSFDPYEEAVPATAVATLRGDAAERALMAWTLGWQPALDVGGGHWTLPLLGELLLDPYDAVRYIAERTLRRHHPQYADLAYDPLAPDAARRAAVAEILARWRTLPPEDGRPAAPSDLIVDPSGQMGAEAFRQLLADRDHRVVRITE